MPRGSLSESHEFPMARPREGHPDFYARFATAYDAELCEFVRRVGAGDTLEPGLEIGWRTLLVANLAEASARQGGRQFELTQHGGPIASADDAAAFAAETMAQVEGAP